MLGQRMTAERMKKVDKMPLKTIEAMLKSPKTPERLKKAWRKKLKMIA